MSEIGARFDRATTYESHARVQTHAATRLTALIAGATADRTPQRVLELGCGTGLLTRRVRALLPESRYLATDISAGMLNRVAGMAGARQIEFAQMDAEAPEALEAEGARFDLICSSLCIQWFANRGPSIARLAGLLAPGGVLALSTLADGSLNEWRDAHRAEGLTHAGHAYPTLATLTQDTAGIKGVWREETYRDAPGGGLAFARDLRGIGADMPRVGHHPLSPGQLRRVIARFDAAGGHVTYRLAYGIFDR